MLLFSQYDDAIASHYASSGASMDAAVACSLYADPNRSAAANLQQSALASHMSGVHNAMYAAHTQAASNHVSGNHVMGSAAGGPNDVHMKRDKDLIYG